MFRIVIIASVIVGMLSMAGCIPLVGIAWKIYTKKPKAADAAPGEPEEDGKPSCGPCVDIDAAVKEFCSRLADLNAEGVRQDGGQAPSAAPPWAVALGIATSGGTFPDLTTGSTHGHRLDNANGTTRHDATPDCNTAYVAAEIAAAAQAAGIEECGDAAKFATEDECLGAL